VRGQLLVVPWCEPELSLRSAHIEVVRVRISVAELGRISGNHPRPNKLAERASANVAYRDVTTSLVAINKTMKPAATMINAMAIQAMTRIRLTPQFSGRATTRHMQLDVPVPTHRASFRTTADRFNVVTIRIKHKGGVVVLSISRPQPRPAIICAARAQSRFVKGIHCAS